MDEAITRLKLAAAAGADVCFIEGVKTKELLESTVAALAPKPVSFQRSLPLGQIMTQQHLQVLVNVISGGLTPSFTYPEAEQMGAKIISMYIHSVVPCCLLTPQPVFSLVSCVAMVHAVRAAMKSLKKTGTDFSSAQGMDPRSFFEVMGEPILCSDYVQTRD